MRNSSKHPDVPGTSVRASSDTAPLAASPRVGEGAYGTRCPAGHSLLPEHLLDGQSLWRARPAQHPPGVPPGPRLQALAATAALQKLRRAPSGQTRPPPDTSRMSTYPEIRSFSTLPGFARGDRPRTEKYPTASKHDLLCADRDFFSSLNFDPRRLARTRTDRNEIRGRLTGWVSAVGSRSIHRRISALVSKQIVHQITTSGTARSSTALPSAVFQTRPRRQRVAVVPQRLIAVEQPPLPRLPRPGASIWYRHAFRSAGQVSAV